VVLNHHLLLHQRPYRPCTWALRRPLHHHPLLRRSRNFFNRQLLLPPLLGSTSQSNGLGALGSGRTTVVLLIGARTVVVGVMMQTGALRTRSSWAMERLRAMWRRLRVSVCCCCCWGCSGLVWAGVADRLHSTALLQPRTCHTQPPSQTNPLQKQAS